MSGTLTISGALMLPCAGRSVRLASGVLVVRDGRIESISESPSPSPDLGGEGRLVCPGFIDAHVHLPQFDVIGVGGLELLDWLDRVVFPAEARWADADFAREMTARVVRTLLSYGTTGMGAYATVHAEAARGAIETAAELGVRAIIGQVLMDRDAPDDLIRPRRELIAQASRLEPRGRVEPAVTPRFALSCTDELLRDAGELASGAGWAVQTHLAETEAECARVHELYRGVPYTEVYRRAGLLTGRSILAHGIWLDDASRAAISGAGAVVAHCPTANRFLRAGAMDRHMLDTAGVRQALGSDVAGGPDRSMVRVARAMLETAHQLGASGPDAGEAWWQITTGNADALGWGRSGRLAVGAEADIVVARPSPGWLDHPDPLSMLLHAWDDRWLETTIVGGRVAYEQPVCG